MCGIAGAVAPRGTVELAAVERMASVLVHRGPDDVGAYIEFQRRAAFGFRRLAIIDLTTGNQPMSNEDGTVHLVYNGEIYNYRELRGWLEERGHRFATNSDSETIVHAYEELGVECLHRLRGMFALAIWDERRGRLFAARDRVGIKPLYWTLVDGQLLFASEIKALLAYPGVRAEVDEVALYHYLTFLTAPAPLTLFRGIRKLPPGHWLTFDGSGEPRVERYWDPAVAIDPRMTEADAIDRTRVLVEDAVRSHMISDVPFGAFLSGGVDSCTNVALMQRHMDRPADTFSVGFAESARHNELGPARAAAVHFGTNHRDVEISFDDALGYLPEMVYHQDEPLGDPVCIPLRFVSKLMRDNGVVVGHVGEGADELFFGYTGYMRALQLGRMVAPLRALPAAAWRIAAHVAKPVSQRVGRGAGAVDALSRLGRGELAFWGGHVAFDEAAKAPLLTENSRRRLRDANSHEVVRGIADDLLARQPDADLAQLIAYQDMRLRLPELLLMRVDKITMSTSIEARVPFLDHPLVEHALSIPSAVKLAGGTKHILKRAVNGIVPNEVLARQKRGFDAPTSMWFHGRLGEQMSAIVRGSALAAADLIAPNHLTALVDEHRAGATDHSIRLWAVLNLLLWYELWIAGRDPRMLLDPLTAVPA